MVYRVSSIVVLCCIAQNGIVCCPCSEDDTIGDLKKLVAAQTGTRPEKIRIQKWYAAAELLCPASAFAIPQHGTHCHWDTTIVRHLPLKQSQSADALGSLAELGRSSDPVVECVRTMLAAAGCVNTAATLTLTRSCGHGCRYTVYKDHITLEDYEVHDGMGLELYYN